MKFSATCASAVALALTTCVSARETQKRDMTNSLNQGLWQIHDSAGDALKDVANAATKIKRTPMDLAGHKAFEEGFWDGLEQKGVIRKDFTDEVTQGLSQIHDNAGQALSDVASVATKIKRDVGDTLALRDLFSEGRVGLVVRGDDTEFHSRIARSCAPPPCGTPSGCNDWTPCLPTDDKGDFVKRAVDVHAEFDSALAVRNSLAAAQSTLMIRRDDTEAHILARCAPPPCGTPTGCAMWTPCLYVFASDDKGNFV